MSSDIVLPPFLANAALLITAPSLGCLTTYTKTLSELCLAYEIPIPDFTHVLQYIPTSTSMISPILADTFQTEDYGVIDFQEPNNDLVNEYVASDIEVKQEPLEYATFTNNVSKTTDEKYSLVSTYGNSLSLEDPKKTNSSLKQKKTSSVSTIPSQNEELNSSKNVSKTTDGKSSLVSAEDNSLLLEDPIETNSSQEQKESSSVSNIPSQNNELHSSLKMKRNVIDRLQQNSVVKQSCEKVRGSMLQDHAKVLHANRIKCNYCGEILTHSFGPNSPMIRHIEAIHSIKFVYKERSKRSIIWKHVQRIGIDQVKCNYCDHLFKIKKSSTGGTLTHLLKYHPDIVKDERPRTSAVIKNPMPKSKQRPKRLSIRKIE